MFIINAKIVTVKDGTIENGFIEIEDKIIKEVGEMTSLKNIEIQNSEIYDASGFTVYPGFIDAHSHLGIWEDGIGFEGDDGNEDTDPSTPHLRALDAVNYRDRCFVEAAEAGITTVVTGPGSSNPIGGQILALKTLGESIDEALVLSPLGIKFALGENPKTSYHGKNQSPVTRMATAAIIREQLFKAKRYLDDLNKAFEDEDFDEPDYDIKCEALIPLLEGKIKGFFHAHRLDDILTVKRICKEFEIKPIIIHATEGHLKPEYLLDIPVLIGPIICDRSKPELKALTPKAAAILHKNNIDFAICTDHPVTPIQYLFISVATAVKEGLDINKAIESITLAPARICGIDSKVGSITKGKDADLVVFKDNPISGNTKPECVFINGRRIELERD